MTLAIHTGAEFDPNAHATCWLSLQLAIVTQNSSRIREGRATEQGQLFFGLRAFGDREENVGDESDSRASCRIATYSAMQQSRNSRGLLAVPTLCSRHPLREPALEFRIHCEISSHHVHRASYRPSMTGYPQWCFAMSASLPRTSEATRRGRTGVPATRKWPPRRHVGRSPRLAKRINTLDNELKDNHTRTTETLESAPAAALLKETGAGPPMPRSSAQPDRTGVESVPKLYSPLLREPIPSPRCLETPSDTDSIAAADASTVRFTCPSSKWPTIPQLAIALTG